jgi:hypothetical protein
VSSPLFLCSVACLCGMPSPFWAVPPLSSALWCLSSPCCALLSVLCPLLSVLCSTPVLGPLLCGAFSSRVCGAPSLSVPSSYDGPSTVVPSSLCPLCHFSVPCPPPVICPPLCAVSLLGGALLSVLCPLSVLPSSLCCAFASLVSSLSNRRCPLSSLRCALLSAPYSLLSAVLLCLCSSL